MTPRSLGYAVNVSAEMFSVRTTESKKQNTLTGVFFCGLLLLFLYLKVHICESENIPLNTKNNF
ncbi:hypothetical protein BZL53_10380 [Flavobacterium columnare]|nr:hypothetical protein BZL53_10380 [Flavobacterium columnare]